MERHIKYNETVFHITKLFNCFRNFVYVESVSGINRTTTTEQNPPIIITLSSPSRSHVFIFLLLICNFCDVSGCCSKSQNLPPENVKKLASAINEMTLNLHKRLAENATDNVFYSPLSIAVALEILFYGTRGETAEELRNTLGYSNAGLPDQLVHQTFHHLLCDIEMDNNPANNYSLTLANSILVDEKMGLLPSYKNEVKDLFDASVQNVDFSKDTTAVVQRINEWVDQQTRGKIKEIIKELDESTVMVLLNAVYFKGIWLHPFDVRYTWEELFYNDGSISKARYVPMMHLKQIFSMHFSKDFTALEMPYKGDNISMLILMPSSLDGLPNFEKSLTLKKLTDIYRNMRKVTIEVTMPKFKFEYTKELKKDFEAMGATRIFIEGLGDFSGMISSNKVHVSSVLHKAVIEVDEKGSEAAAATAMIAERRTRPEQFIVDHPFLFAVLNKRSGTDIVLFIGRVSHL